MPRSAQKGFAVGFWPLPEAFWPDGNAPSLPQRSAHPKVTFSCTNQEPMIIDNLPFDKYELEPSPLTLFILARKQPKACWQVYIQARILHFLTVMYRDTDGSVNIIFNFWMGQVAGVG